jgi:pSer/pThr/pTyr-binding forkhead associated (FHA) protein
MATVRVRVHDAESGADFCSWFRHSPIRVGRDQLNDIRLEQSYVSQFHLRIDVSHGRIFARELGTSNGAHHRGRPLRAYREVDITDEPWLQIGAISIQVTLATAVDVSPEESPARAETVDELVARVERCIHDYRLAWTKVYRLVYEIVPKLSATDRVEFLRRLANKEVLAAESDFRLLAAHHGISVPGSPSRSSATDHVRDAWIDLVSAETPRSQSCPPSS